MLISLVLISSVNKGRTWRKDHILKKVFAQRKSTDLIISFYHAVFPMFKSFVLLLEKKEPQIHRLHIEQLRLAKNFLACVLKPEHIQKSSKKLVKLKVNLPSIQLNDQKMLLGTQAKKNWKEVKKCEEELYF